jgi:hypothetical protein
VSDLEIHRLPPDGRRICQGAKKASTSSEIKDDDLTPDETEI